MKHYKVQDDTNVYFSTCTIVQWQCIFKEEKYFRIIVDSLNYCTENKGLSVIGYVIMLNHLHLISYNTDETKLSNIMRDFKHHTSSEMAKQLEKDNAKLFFYILKRQLKTEQNRTTKYGRKNFIQRQFIHKAFFYKNWSIYIIIRLERVWF